MTAGTLLHSEWTKFRTVRGWVVTMLVASLLTVGVALLDHSECGVSYPGPNGTIINAGCPSSPTGPSGEAVTDEFFLAHRPLSGNGTLTARVTSLTGKYSPGGGGIPATGNPLANFTSGTQPWSKTGLMIKASTAQGAAYAAIMVTGSNGVRMQWNFTGDAPGMAGTVSAASPRWLRLVRSGSTVSGYDSPDGTHWTLVGSVSLAGFPRVAQAGLFAASPGHENYTQSLGGGSGTGGPTLATGTFDNVSLSPSGSSGGTAGSSGGGAGGPWTGTSVGGGGPVPGDAGLGGPGSPGSPGSPFNGSFTQAGGVLTVTGSGDIAPDVPSAPDGNGMSAQNTLTGSFFALVAIIIVAAMFITGEYRRGMIRTTFAATPRRGRVLAAKAVVIAAVTFVVGCVGSAIALPLGEAILRRGGNWIVPISALTEVRMIAGTGALLAVAAVLALALGTIARRGVAAVAAVIVVIFLPYLLGIVPGLLPAGAQEWLLRVTPAAAFSVQQAFPVYHQVLAQYTPGNGYFPLAPWTGFAVLCAWAGAALFAADYLLRRRDV